MCVICEGIRVYLYVCIQRAGLLSVTDALKAPARHSQELWETRMASASSHPLAENLVAVTVSGSMSWPRKEHRVLGDAVLGPSL